MPRISSVSSLFVNLCIHFEKGEGENERGKRDMCAPQKYIISTERNILIVHFYIACPYGNRNASGIFLQKQKESSRKYIAKLIIRNYRGSNSPSSPSLFLFPLFFSPYLFPSLSLPPPPLSFSPSPSSSLSRDNYIFLTSNYKKLRLRKL